MSSPSLDKQAVLVQAKVDDIVSLCQEILLAVQLVLRKEGLGTHMFETSDSDKQKLIAFYQTKKSELITLVGELP